MLATKKMITIRKAQIADAKAIAKVHVSSWQAIYRDHISDSVLDNLSINEREKSWKALLESNVNILVLEEDNSLIGFVSFCPNRDQDANPAVTAEISSIYLNPDKWRKGFGRLLLNAALDALQEMNYTEVILWVVDSNQQAKQFYKSFGFVDSFDSKMVQREGYTLHEVRYCKRLK